MDAKLERVADFHIWQELFPEFIEKGIRRDLLALFAQPQYRFGLIRLIEEGKYQFDAPRETSIPKDGGGERLIYILSNIDRCVMSVVTHVYVELYGKWIHSACKSYQKGFSVPAILHDIRRKLEHGGYKVDLSKYFDSVPRWKINKMLQRMDTGSPVDQLLWDFYNTDVIIRDGKPVRHFKSLGQGCAFSSLLANLCLAEVDEEMFSMCEVYIRYSDDILMLGNKADEALAVLKERLADLGLQLNPKKVQGIHAGSAFTFLGGKICNEQIHLSNKVWASQKKAVRKITRRGKRGSRALQRKAVKNIQKYFIGKSGSYCMLEYFCFLCTDGYDMQRLDEYCRNEIKAIYTGKHNHATNEHKTSNEMIYEWGWVNLAHLYRLYKMSRHVFDAKLAAMRENNICPANVVNVDQVWFTPNMQVNLVSGLVRVDGRYVKVLRKKRKGVLERIEELWPKARLYEGFTALNVKPNKNHVYTYTEQSEINLAIKEIELLIVTTVWNFEEYFWQSKAFPELIIFREWTISN